MGWYPVKEECWETVLTGRRFDILCVGNTRVFIRWHSTEEEDTLPLDFFDPELNVLRLV